jgi:hypothetical protein
MKFPRLVYKSAASFVLVESEEAHAEKLAEGWFDTVPEAIAGVSAKPELVDLALAPPTPEPGPVEGDEPPTRDELKQKARDLGIEFAPNIPTAKLAELVDLALAKG